MKKAFRYSLRHSLPILISFIPVGIAYGILMQTAGLNWIWTGACSLFIFAGSLQFLAVSFFAGGVSLVTVAVMALLLNSRHIFYGIPFIEQWRRYGVWRLFLIFALPDEAFSLHCSNRFDEDDAEGKKWSFVFDALLILIYWVALSILGALVCSLIPFDTAGIDFALTALFIVILIEQLKAPGKSALPALIAAVSSGICLLCFGPSGFILPSLMITVLGLIVFRGPISRAEKEGGHA
ncbi:MAG: AzlC family ABC transporter permease [Oscillospiraceae bacterium]|nr:AzlC family ABC transporter permease [Oscillospiraceae bacterium]